MTQFARDFVASIEGTKVDVSTKELSGGARIYYIFNDVFGSALDSIDATQNLENQDIRTAIRNSTGPRPSLFVPEIAFDLLVKPQIKLLEMPSLRCVELVYEELVKICHNCTNSELQRFPGLHAKLIEVVSELLRERLGPTSEYTESLIAIQAAYINTNHPAFISGSAAAAQQASSPPAPQMPLRPTSTEPTNGTGTEDDDVDSSDENGLPNGMFPPRQTDRSVSASLPDRTRASTGSAPATLTSRKIAQPRPQSAMSAMTHRGSPPSAREAFLNYFFGQNGPGPLSGSAVGSNPAKPVGRDLSGGEVSTMAMASGLMSGQRVDGQNAAFDMKSLGKHIEAVPFEGNQLTMREEMETSLIRSLITSYFGIVRQTIQDLVPKAIMHLLVNHTSNHVQNRLVASLYKPELFQEMLHEDEGLVAERTRVKALLDAYKEAFKTLSDVNVKPT
ncbi:unnamed protein product [Mycena citricolor]|uniref:GED domain-containing protein n=1 Tax=Mycena citricolor TaxID=2018698 RepID=A0AAD2H0B1_9AGAR|nr:unnamed protein product [Mycena citricolor]